jgi:ABC-type uncharacterized transport system YnjBCD substrate-binding protein
MRDNVFLEKEPAPDDARLEELLGRSSTHLRALHAYVEERCGTTTREWKFYGKSGGWQMKTLLKKRNLFFLVPHAGSFSLGFIFGDRAVDAIQKSELPESVKAALREARKYAEGRGHLLEVKKKADVAVATQLVNMKVQY